MIIIDCLDIQKIIVSYFDEATDLLAWRHTCTSTMHVFTANFVYHTFSDLFNVIALSLLSDNNEFTRNIDKHASKVTYLDCGYNTKLSDLTKFVNLTLLKCSYNKKIKHLPEQLLRLSCGWNNRLNDKDISHLHNLKVLQCDFNSSITSVGIGALTGLERLEVGLNTRITDDVFKNLKNLRYLKCNNSNLTDLTLLYLPNLECLHCGTNSTFTNRGLSYVPKLCTLNCGVSTTFTDDGFKCIKNLQHLDCDGNNTLTDKALTYLPNLISLDCGTNKLFTDDGLLSLPNLKKVTPRYNRNFSKETLLKFKVSYKYNSYLSYYRHAAKN